MKTIGFPLYETTPQIDEAPAMQKICQRYAGKALIRVQDIEINPIQAEELDQLAKCGGRFIEIVTDGPDEAQLAAAIHQQLAKDKFSY